MLSAVKEALFTPLALENVEAFNKGETPKNIINMYFLQMTGEFGGSGVTIGDRKSTRLNSSHIL